MPTTHPAAAPGCPTGGAEPRWFGDGRHARAVARKETVVAEGRGFQAVFRRCAAGGVVVSLPAVPHLMTRGATYQHARVKAIALADGYLHALRAAGRLAPPGEHRGCRSRPEAVGDLPDAAPWPHNGRAMAGRDSEFVSYVVESLQPLGPVTAKRMFGGHGIYLNGVMFALIAYETLYFKVDDGNRSAYEAGGLEPFTYTDKGKPIRMPYHEAPSEGFDDPDVLCAWARDAYAAALRTKKPKRSQC